MARRGRSGQEWNAAVLRGARDRLGLTQVEMADRLGVNVSAVANWERSTTWSRAPQHPRVVQLAILAVEAGLDQEEGASA